MRFLLCFVFFLGALEAKSLRLSPPLAPSSPKREDKKELVFDLETKLSLKLSPSKLKSFSLPLQSPKISLEEESSFDLFQKPSLLVTLSCDSFSIKALANPLFDLSLPKKRSVIPALFENVTYSSHLKAPSIQLTSPLLEKPSLRDIPSLPLALYSHTLSPHAKIVTHAPCKKLYYTIISHHVTRIFPKKQYPLFKSRQEDDRLTNPSFFPSALPFSQIRPALAVKTLSLPNQERDFFKNSKATSPRPVNLETKERIFPTLTLIEWKGQIRETKTLKIAPRTNPYPPIETNAIAFPFGAINYTQPLLSSLKQIAITLPSLIDQTVTSLLNDTFCINLVGDKRPLSEMIRKTNDVTETNRTYRLTQYNLLHFPSLEALGTESLGDEFDLALRASSSTNQDGFLFSIQLSSRHPEEIEPIGHRIYFILDKSSSIDKHRFEVFKKSILSSLPYIDNRAHFNILSLDQEVSFISSNDLRPTRSSIQFVQRAFQKITRSRQANFGTLSLALAALQEKAKASKEVYTVILLSNGQLMKNIRFHRDALNQFMHGLPNNFSLFGGAMSDQNNLEMLDLLTRLGRGSLLYSDTHASFPRKFSILMKKLQYPIATNIQTTHIGLDSTIGTDFNPIMPIFYRDKPYTILCQTKTLEPFDLLLQGYQGRESRESWINIKKEVKLKEITHGGAALEKEMAKQRAFKEKIRFLLTNDSAALLESDKKLAPFDKNSLYR